MPESATATIAEILRHEALRHFKGDRTTAGGTVITGDANDRLYDRERAYERDKVWCPARQSTGYIVCDGPRLPTTDPDGREVALNDDLCVCKCEPSPRLLASQNVSYIDLDSGPVARLTDGLAADTAVSVEHDEQYVLLDAKTDRPMADISYRIVTGCSQTFTGITNTAGQTNRIWTDLPSSLKFIRRETHSMKNFDANDDGNWFLVHSGAVTNTNPGSVVEVMINTEKICPNMTNKEFREMALNKRDQAVSLIAARLHDLQRWAAVDKARVQQWFGRHDEDTRAKLINGLTAITRVLKGLTGYNFTRWDSERHVHIGCVPNPNKSGVVASVCSPDTETHTIAIHLDFCSMRDFSWDKDSVVSTLIHEASHFSDTMSTKDHRYFMNQCLTFGAENPDQAINNADSISGYVIYNA
ncbi:M35 family metallo-endopeptidase [Burkholderia stagnalis]|uniref:M35 family metallo-endopeptidase n=1 Tax=Burkholderia stagnalis TaxID=1503054 RepID=UPI002ED79443